jgi:hypothetical protein
MSEQLKITVFTAKIVRVMISLIIIVVSKEMLTQILHTIYAGTMSK